MRIFLMLDRAGHMAYIEEHAELYVQKWVDLPEYENIIFMEADVTLT